jgi:hypothetical protein
MAEIRAEPPRSSPAISKSPLTGQPLEILRAWGQTQPPESPPIVYLTGPPSYAKTAVLNDLAGSFAGHMRVLRLGPSAALEIMEQFNVLIDDLADGTGGPLPRLVIVDDLEDLSHIRGARGQVLLALANPDALNEGRCRFVIGLVKDPDRVKHDQIMRIDIGYVHPRARLLDRISRWVADPTAPGLMFVSGPPGAGKSYLLKDATRVINGLADTQVAHASIRDWSQGAPATMTMTDLTSDLATAFSVEGLDLVSLAASRVTSTTASLVSVVQEVKVNYGTITGAKIVLPHPGAPSAETIIAALAGRASEGTPAYTLVLVIDALDEWEIFGIAALSALRELLSRHDSFPAWNLKILLSGQYRPDWLPAAELVDLADVDAEPDMRDFAAARLTVTALPAADQQELIGHVVRLSGGLFLVASGYLDEIIAGELTAADLARAPLTPAGTAMRYYIDALKRNRDRIIVAGQAERWRDAERFLVMLAVVPNGRSAADMIKAWTDDSDPVSTDDWYDVRDWLEQCPLRRYIVATDAGRYYRLVHSTMREALAQLVPFDERHSVSAERRRWIQTRTPLSPAGPSWDHSDGRAAIAEVGTILAEMLRAALTRKPIDERALDETRSWAKRLLENWDWIEECVRYAEPDGLLPLGFPQVLHQIGMMTKADPGLALLELWNEPDPPAGTEYARPAPEPPRRKPRRDVHAHAHAGHPYIKEILSGGAWFRGRPEAGSRLKHIADRYELSKWSRPFDEREQIILFIKGFDLSLEDRRANVKGHYARLWVAPAGDGWTIRAERYEVRKGDPIAARPPTPRDPPDWGDPLLSRVRGTKANGRHQLVFASQKDAQAELDRLKRRKPGNVTELPGKMLLRVYDRHGPVSPTTGKRLTLTQVMLLIVRTDRGFEIEARILGYGRKDERLSYDELLRRQREEGK